jgi:hypothetical protein
MQSSIFRDITAGSPFKEKHGVISQKIELFKI